MNSLLTVIHVRDSAPDTIESAIQAIFATEGRSCVFQLRGAYTAVLDRLESLAPTLDDPTDDTLSDSAPTLDASASATDAPYRYLILRPHPSSAWVPILELGARADGLDIELSRHLDGVPVFTVFAYDDAFSGYRYARDGSLIDHYTSDPTYLLSPDDDPSDAEQTDSIAEQRGHPERFADLLPPNDTPADLARIVLRPGWWERHDPANPSLDASAPTHASDDDEEFIDEYDRMRCIALALELWGPTDYPLAQDPQDIPARLVGPAIALAFT